MNPPSPSESARRVSVFSDRRPALARRRSFVSPIDSVDLVCFSHLRWDFVFQRPQQLMTRAARTRRVFFVEEPVFDAAAGQSSVDIRQPYPNVYVVVPHLVSGISEAARIAAERETVDELFRTFEIHDAVLWYWTPMPLNFTRHLDARAIVFDCMDELAGFAGAPQALKDLERELIARADVMFTGGVSLYEAKRALHHNIHAFPSSVDVAHFARARQIADEPDDQRGIPQPRLGFFGVIDERMDLELLGGVAARRPDWHLVLLGPTCKIDPAALPTGPNLHYLGMKSYDQLPHYLAGWNVAMLPFARNDATRFISPTKTPEYLAAGRPVVSTSIRDVVRPYGENGLVHIADDADGFVSAVEAAMQEDAAERHRRVAIHLAGQSWDATWSRMDALVMAACHAAHPASETARVAHV